MNNKKVWFTIIIAVILAFFTAFFILKPHKTAKPEQYKKIKQEKQINTTVPEIQQEKTESAKQQKRSEPAYVKKQTSNKKLESTSKTPKILIEQNIEQDMHAEVSITEQEELEQEVIVPVKFTSKNTYKYVYTPYRYTSGK